VLRSVADLYMQCMPSMTYSDPDIFVNVGNGILCIYLFGWPPVSGSAADPYMWCMPSMNSSDPDIFVNVGNGILHIFLLPSF
jgi:hypothetical protein